MTPKETRDDVMKMTGFQQAVHVNDLAKKVRASKQHLLLSPSVAGAISIQVAKRAHKEAVKATLRLVP
jgi:hypothetical protein